MSTDAHITREFPLVHYGLDQPRRAGLTGDDVLNCLAWDQLGRIAPSATVSFTARWSPVSATGKAFLKRLHEVDDIDIVARISCMILNSLVWTIKNMADLTTLPHQLDVTKGTCRAIIETPNPA